MLPIYTKETLTEWADKIDNRLGPIPGSDADALARLLRATAARVDQIITDRNEQDLALHDAISETSRCADELAFWRYQAIWLRAYLHNSSESALENFENSEAWKRAERELEALRSDENRERTAHAEAPRDVGGT